jgi:small multidrug resistance family-3 protein
MQMMSKALPFLVLFLSAVLEVGGDALMRRGIRGGGWVFIVVGGLVLAGYGMLVNRVPWDFGRMLGAYVAFFAVVSVVFGRFAFGDRTAATTWIGLLVIALGAGLLQLGR